ncbi:MAG: WbqC family protein [Bacteroidales bacterium]|nr:WbqC family protein [Candidatus Cryptobacteroides aphodequi]
MLLSIAYCPPVEYFAILAEYSARFPGRPVYVEACESYCKQSYRNRCRILTSNGPEDLRIPIVHDGARLITDIKVDYSTPWVRQTEYAIETAYQSSPFLEYYRDGFFGILDSAPATLWDLDMALTRYFCSKVGLTVDFEATTDFVAVLPSEPAAGPDAALSAELAAGPAAETFAGGDFRLSIHPKKPSSFRPRPYWQVFREKLGFVGNLSIMGLLFNEGPESITYLK